MTDIKFRFYDKIKGEMFYWTPENQVISLEAALLVPARYIVMQYIGRHDVNKKDIYAGDIDINNGEVVWCDELNWDGGGSKHPGFYFKGCWKYGEVGELSYHDGFNDCEILGNVYENPELLEKK